MVDINLDSLRTIDQHFGGRVNAVTPQATIAELVQGADLVIGNVLIPGAAAPKLVSEEMISTMMPGSVIVDVAIDRGCFATSRQTTHAEPTFCTTTLFIIALRTCQEQCRERPALRSTGNAALCKRLATGPGRR